MAPQIFAVTCHASSAEAGLQGKEEWSHTGSSEEEAFVVVHNWLNYFGNLAVLMEMI